SAKTENSCAIRLPTSTTGTAVVGGRICRKAPLATSAKANPARPDAKDAANAVAISARSAGSRGMLALALRRCPHPALSRGRIAAIGSSWGEGRAAKSRRRLRALIQLRHHELAVAQRLGAGEAAVAGADHDVDQPVPGLIEGHLAAQDAGDVEI